MRFVGNVAWLEGRQLWQDSQQKRLVRPPFPTLIRRQYGEQGRYFDWSGVVRLDSWTGFATPAEVSPDGWFPSRGWVLDGDLSLKVEPASPIASSPTDEQAATFQFLLDYQQTLCDTVLQAIFDVYPNWRNKFYGSSVSPDGGATWQSGWELPDQFPPEHMPEIATPDDLRRLIRPQTIYVVAKPKHGQTRLGISFSCRWDEEHGLGVSTHMGRVIEAGAADVAFAEDTS